jgi:hypothetical protein
MAKNLCTGCRTGLALISQAVMHVRSMYPFWRRNEGARIAACMRMSVHAHARIHATHVTYARTCPHAGRARALTQLSHDVPYSRHPVPFYPISPILSCGRDSRGLNHSYARDRRPMPSEVRQGGQRALQRYGGCRHRPRHRRVL